MLIKKVRSVGRGAWFGALAGLAGGLVLAMPGGPAPAGVMHALMAGASTGTAGGTQAPHDGPTTTVTRPHPTTTLPAHEATTTAPDHGSTPPPATPHTTSTTSAPSPSDQGGAPAGATTTCDGAITAFHVTVLDGGRALRLEVAVTGQVGWMSAYAPGFGGAALTAVPGGFAGTITGTAPVAPGTEVLVGSCHNRVRASTTVGGDTPPGSTTPPAATPGGSTTTTAPPSETTGCAMATVTSVSARLRGGGSAVTVNVLVSGTVESMSGEVNGFGVIALHAVPGGFEGTLSVNGSIPAGTEVVVGTCGGKVRATASVVAA